MIETLAGTPLPVRHPRRQAGEGRIGCVFWTVAVVFFAYVAWQMVPVKMKSVDLEQFMVRSAERASIQARNTEKALRAAILQEAESLDLPLQEENLTVVRTGSRVKIHASYTVPIHLVVTTWDWTITHSVERNILRI